MVIGHEKDQFAILAGDRHCRRSAETHSNTVRSIYIMIVSLYKLYIQYTAYYAVLQRCYDCGTLENFFNANVSYTCANE